MQEFGVGDGIVAVRPRAGLQPGGWPSVTTRWHGDAGASCTDRARRWVRRSTNPGGAVRSSRVSSEMLRWMAPSWSGHWDWSISSASPRSHGPGSVADRAMPFAQLQIRRVAVVAIGDQGLMRREVRPDLGQVVVASDRPQVGGSCHRWRGGRPAAAALRAVSITRRSRRHRRRRAGSVRGWPRTPSSSPAGRPRFPR